jgi:hypothetical protein
MKKNDWKMKLLSFLICIVSVQCGATHVGNPGTSKQPPVQKPKEEPINLHASRPFERIPRIHKLCKQIAKPELPECPKLVAVDPNDPKRTIITPGALPNTYRGSPCKETIGIGKYCKGFVSSDVPTLFVCTGNETLEDAMASGCSNLEVK